MHNKAKHHRDHEIFTHYSMGEAKRLDTHLVKTKLADGQFNKVEF